MDELLRTPRGLDLPERGRQAYEKLYGRLHGLIGAGREKAAAAWEVLRAPVHALADWAERHPVSPALYLAVSGAVCAAAVLGAVYTRSYVVNLDGKDIGVVQDAAVYDRAAANVERRASHILGYEYTLDHSVTFTPALSERSDTFTTVSQIETYLFNEVGEIMKGYILTVDGKVIGAADKEAPLNELLECIAAPYRTENTVECGFVEEVKLRNDYITSDYNLDLNQMYAVLTENTTGKTTYDVVGGDTYIGIAAANDMTLNELMALNPQASLDSLFIGDELNVKRIIPYLSVYTVDRETYETVLECPVEYVDDPSLYIGNSKVITQGVEGRALIDADVKYVDGYETERTIVSTTTLEEPTTTVIAQGTTPRPKTASTGSFRWPIYGVITSRFGARTLFGAYDYHTGLDIATYYGAPVKAADGGLVTYSGWQGSYGKLVVVTHDNGTKTYYAHNSSLAVSVGQRVYQGQVVAYAGSTGNSTGVHCHFGVVVGGKYVNPLAYLP